MTDVSKEQLLEDLKAQATELGIKFHPATGPDKLQIKIDLALAADEEETEVIAQPVEPVVAKVAVAPSIPKTVLADVVMPVETKSMREMRQRKDASRLIRIRVTCMNPAKSAWPGEVFTVSNSVVGTHKKFVPFNNDEGYHVPNIIYKHMKEKQCQIMVPRKLADGTTTNEGKIINELAIEVLEPLTKDQLEDLARTQALGKNID